MYVIPNTVTEIAKACCVKAFREGECAWLLHDCSVIPSPTELAGVEIYTSWMHRKNFILPSIKFLLQSAARCNLDVVVVRWQSIQGKSLCRRYPVAALSSGDRPDPNPDLPPIRPTRKHQEFLTPVVRSRFEVDYNALHSGSNCVYINQIQDQTNLWANNAALQAQGKKPSEFLIVQNAFTLNDEGELRDRMKHLLRDDQITGYDYQAWRWFQEPETGMWLRRRMSFTSNFWRIDYLGEDCWLGEVLRAEPLESFAGAEMRS